MLVSDPFDLVHKNADEIKKVIRAVEMANDAALPHYVKYAHDPERYVEGPSYVLWQAMGDLALRDPQHAWNVLNTLRQDEEENVRSQVLVLFTPLFSRRRELFTNSEQLRLFYVAYINSLNDCSNCELDSRYDFQSDPQPDVKDFLAAVEAGDINNFPAY